MKKVAMTLALTVTLFATPVSALGLYKLQLLVDIYAVSVRCAPLDAKYAALGESVLGELKAEGYTESQLAAAAIRDASGIVNHAKCAALIRPLVSTYLAAPE